MHGFVVLICGTFVYMCILIMILFHNSSTKQPFLESQIIAFKPGIHTTMYPTGFMLKTNSFEEP